MGQLSDKIKKALLPSTSINVDKEALWQDVERELNKNKKRRPILWIFFISGLGTAGLWYLLNISPETVLPSNFETTNEISTNNHKRGQSKTATSSAENRNEPKLIRQAISAGNSTQLINGNSSISKSEFSHSHQTKSTRFIPVATFQPTAIDPESSKPGLVKEVVLKVTGTNQNEEESENRNEDFLNETISIHPLSITLIRLLEAKKPIDLPYLPSMVISTPTVDVMPAWQWHVASGIGFWKVFHAGHQPQLSEISAKRDGLSTPKENMMAALYVKKKIWKAWQLGFGLQYNRLTEIIQGEDIQTIITEVSSDSALYYKGANGIDYFNGTLTQIQRKGYKIFSPNSIQRWSFPIELSYQMRKGPLHIVPACSFVYNISQSYDGIYMGPDGRFIYKDKNAFEQLYRSSGVHAWGLSLKLHWMLSQKLGLTTGIWHQRDLRNVLNNSTGLWEQYYLTGLQLGVVYVW